MKKANPLLLGLLALLLGPTVCAQSLPREEAVPGGVVLIDLGAREGASPKAYYQGRQVMVIGQGQRWSAVVGLGLNAAQGHHTLRVHHDKGDDATRAFTVHPKQYEEQHITLKDKRMVNPYAKDLERIRAEQARSRKAFASWREIELESLGLQLPVQGRLSGSFGKRRFFNEQPRRPHSGIDIAAPTGTPVIAPLAGRIVETGDYFFNGKTVFIDHGQGLISMFCHLDSIGVQVGEAVQAGQEVAQVGATGRVTGPHLHWSLSLNNVRVNPLLFIAPEAIAALEHPATQN